MNNFKKYFALCALSLLAATGCDKPKKIEPAKLGQRNDTCLAKNDCGSGLSCINTVCQPTSFDLSSSGKECIRHECETTTDCCGDLPTEAPAKCAGREETCDPAYATIPGCSTFGTCDSAADCGGGDCGNGYCADDGFFFGCDSDADCTPTAATCVGSLCDDGTTVCSVAADCPVPTNTNTCISKECDCTNPNYNPSATICSDPDCDDVCTVVCNENKLCVQDDSCETDTDCIYQVGDICDTATGKCIECESDTDCDEDNKEVCNDVGFCERPCEFDQECGAFEACEAGECVFKGCADDLDCVLYSSFPDADRRLAQCRPGADGLGECRLPCENDGHCNETEICSGGFCEYIGCQSDAQCDRLLGLNNQTVSNNRPYVTVGMCVAPVVE